MGNATISAVTYMEVGYDMIKKLSVKYKVRTIKKRKPINEKNY